MEIHAHNGKARGERIPVIIDEGDGSSNHAFCARRRAFSNVNLTESCHVFAFAFSSFPFSWRFLRSSCGDVRGSAGGSRFAHPRLRSSLSSMTSVTGRVG